MSENFKQWILAKIKGLSDYHPPLDNRDEEHEIYGWMHVLCNDHESIKTFFRLHEEGYRRNKEEVAALLTEIKALREYKAKLPADWFEDSSLKTWFPFPAEEVERLREKVKEYEGMEVNEFWRKKNGLESLNENPCGRDTLKQEPEAISRAPVGKDGDGSKP